MKFKTLKIYSCIATMLLPIMAGCGQAKTTQATIESNDLYESVAVTETYSSTSKESLSEIEETKETILFLMHSIT